MTDDWNELRISNDARDDADELRQRLADDGYLFFRRLQDPDKLWSLRRDIMSVLQAGGWLLPETDPMAGIANVNAQCTEGDPEYTDVYHQVQKLQSFHASAHWPEVLDALTQIVGREVMPEPQKVARLWFPRYTEHTTPVHQDYVHFQGHFNHLTCWAPVGDCPRELGGLAVLKGSHKVGRVLDHHFSLGAGSLVVHVDEHDELGNEWLSTDYEIGDTLIFPALTVHKALPNWTENQLRVSLDNRYLAIGDPIADHMLTPHLSKLTPLTWESIYRDWPSEEGKYYWRNYDNPVVPRDLSFNETGFREAIELARDGNEHARLWLRRFISRDPDSDEARRAGEALGRYSV